MPPLPYLIDDEDAIEHYLAHPEATDAVRAYVVGMLHKEGYTNRRIREVLRIQKVYEVTHLTRAGTALSIDELMLWHSNPERITLGHTRAIAAFPASKREDIMRRMLRKKVSVRSLERLAKGQEDNDVDIQRYEVLMAEAIGRPTKIRFNPTKGSGSITLNFFDLQDLDNMAKALGFDVEAHI